MLDTLKNNQLLLISFLLTFQASRKAERIAIECSSRFIIVNTLSHL